MRQIDADALKDLVTSFVGWWEDEGFIVELEAVLRGIDNAPTIEAEPVKHGRWEPHPQTYETVFCSKCGCGNDEFSNYCPHCGAKMDLED